MAIKTVIQITHGSESIQSIKDKFLVAASKPKEELVNIRNFFHAAAGGSKSLSAVVQVNSGDAVAASGTLTLSSFVAGNSFVIGEETFTGSATPSGNNQFLSTGTDTADAAAAVVKINAHPDLLQTATASSSGAVITVTAKVPGRIGNYITLTGGTNVTASGAALAGGTDATTYSDQNTYHAGV